MTIDFKKLAAKLATPWWGPMAPTEYVLKPSGVGVGKIVKQDYGTWNLTLLLRGSYDIPKTLEEQNILIAMWVQSLQLSRIEVRGQSLGSYAMLMDLLEFRAWLGSHLAMPIGQNREILIRQADTLLKVPAQ